MIASAWIALGSLGLVMIAHAVTAAFFAGKQSQRITNLEQAIGDRSAMNNTVIELKVKVEHIEEQMKKLPGALEGIHRQLGNIAMNRVGVSGELK